MIKLKTSVYAVQLHPKGGSRFVPLAQLIRLNLMHVLKGEWPEWTTVSLERDLGSAKRELERIRREIRKHIEKSEESEAEKNKEKL